MDRTPKQILKLTPGEPLSTSALAEISLLAGNLDQAEDLAAQLQQRAEPQYQILGRMIRAVVAGLRNRHDEAAKELHWVGQFLISSGSIPVRVWDYYDMEPLMPKAGSNAKAFGLLLDALMGKIALAEFIPAWAEITPSLQLS